MNSLQIKPSLKANMFYVNLGGTLEVFLVLVFEYIVLSSIFIDQKP